MSSFSHRRGVPSCRKNTDDQRVRRRSRGNIRSCLARLEGWIRNVAARAPIWGDIDIQAFCRVTGYSREHTMRQLSKIRSSRDDLAFETKIRQRKGKKRWGIIVAERTKLLFDRRSLFYDRKGRRLHNYTTLGKGGEKITPTSERTATPKRHGARPSRQKQPLTMNEENHQERSGQLPEPRSDMHPMPNKQPISNGSPPKVFPQKITESVTPPLIERIPTEIQQSQSYSAKRNFGRWREDGTMQARSQAPRTLRRRAFALMQDLSGEHWDNCKVTFSRRAAFCYALQALAEGHEARRIQACYAQSLFVCHGLAVDSTASTGELVFFNPSSTIVKARNLLARDGLTPRERIALWYRNHPRRPPCSGFFEEMDVEELRRRIAESLGGSPVSSDREGVSS